MGNNFPMNAGIANMHPTGDGKYVAISAVTQATAVRLMTMVGGPELAADPRFATPRRARAASQPLYAEIDALDRRAHDRTRSCGRRRRRTSCWVRSTRPATSSRTRRSRRARASCTFRPADGMSLAMPCIVPRIVGRRGIVGGSGRPWGRTPRKSWRKSQRASRPDPSGTRRDPEPRELLVLELGAVIAGPFAGSMMAELGGAVIKIECPDAGDSLRNMGPRKDGIPLWFGTSARDKTCITLNLKHPDGKALFLRLVEKADVLLENFRPGRPGAARARLGGAARGPIPASSCSASRASARRGRRPRARASARSPKASPGSSTLTGEAEQPPLYRRLLARGCQRGAVRGLAIAAALHHRDISGGAGVRIDLALYEPLLRMLDCQLALHERAGAPPARGGTNDPYGFGLAGEAAAALPDAREPIPAAGT